MKSTGLKTMVIVLASVLMAGLAYAGWGGGGRQGGGWYGPRLERGVQENFDGPGTSMWPGPERGGPDTEAWQGGSGRGRGGPDTFGPQAEGPRMGRGRERGSNGSRGRGARPDRSGRPGRGYKGDDVCPYCHGSGRSPVMQRRPLRDHWEQDPRYGRSFRRDADFQGRRGWDRPRRGLQSRNFGPRGQDWGRRYELMQRGPWGGNPGRGPRPDEGIGPGFPDRDFGHQGPGPILRRGPREENRGQDFRPGRGGRGFRRGDGPGPGEGREDRPGLSQGPDVPVEQPGENSPDAETPAETESDSPKEKQVTNEGM